MSRAGLDRDLAAVVQLLERGLGNVQVLEVHPNPPERRPSPPPAEEPAAPAPASLFDPDTEPAPPATAVTPYPLSHLSHIPPSRRWRAVPRHAGAPLSPLAPTPPTRRSRS
jgi:hypothetical protein